MISLSAVRREGHLMEPKPTDIDAYLTSLPDDKRETLEVLRRIIKAVAPDAVEMMAYGMPGFKYRGGRWCI